MKNRKIKQNMLNQITKGNLFVSMNKLMTEMNNSIKTTEIKTIYDMSAVKDKVKQTFKEILSLIDNSREFNTDALKVIHNACVLDFHIRMAEGNGLDLFQLLDFLGDYHSDEFSKAQDNNPFAK